MLSFRRNKRKSKINDVVIKNIPTVPYKEVLLNNVVNEDLQAVLKPLDVMQSLFICAKYSIRDNFITSNSYRYNYVGLFCAVIFRSLIFYQLVSNSVPTIIVWCNVFDVFLFSIGFIINYCSNIINCNNNVLLVLKIQHVHRVLKVDETHLKTLVISNCVYVIVLNFIYLTCNFYDWKRFSLSYILDAMSSYSSISFDINMVYATFVINLLRKALRFWIKEVQLSGNLEGLSSESHWTKMYDLYLNILDAYKIFEKTFCLLVIYYTIHTVCHGLMTVAILLQMKQTLSISGAFALHAVISQSWLIKSTALQILLSFESEKFYATTTEVQSVCTLLKKSRGCSDTQRRICKNIQRQQITSFSKLNAFGFFFIDATLPLEIFSVVAAYTLTLLQFNLS